MIHWDLCLPHSTHIVHCNNSSFADQLQTKFIIIIIICFIGVDEQHVVGVGLSVLQKCICETKIQELQIFTPDHSHSVCRKQAQFLDRLYHQPPPAIEWSSNWTTLPLAHCQYTLVARRVSRPQASSLRCLSKSVCHQGAVPSVASCYITMFQSENHRTKGSCVKKCQWVIIIYQDNLWINGFIRGKYNQYEREFWVSMLGTFPRKLNVIRMSN